MMSTSSSYEVTRLLKRLQDGDRYAAGELLRTLYDDLRRVAARKMANEGSAHTLQPTELVHEAFLRLVQRDELPHWNSSGHFFIAAAEAMRRVLIDHARQKKSQKRGGNRRRVDFSENLIPNKYSAERLLELEDALTALEEQEPKKAELVKLRFFAGFTIEQASEVLGISTTTADRHWAYARAWLKNEMSGEENL